MKGHKVLKYSWEELTGLEELDSDEMESLRLMFVTMAAGGVNSHREVLQRFLQEHTTYIFSKITSDLCVVLYRLLQQGELDRMLRFQAIQEGSPDTEVSVQQLMDLVADSFLVSRRPIPIVSGIVPRIWL